MSGLNGQFNARLQRLERGGSGEGGVPSYSADDEGKVLTVVNDGDKAELSWKNADCLPPYDTNDIGKVLMLGEGSETAASASVQAVEPKWENPIPAPTSDDAGMTVVVNEEGKYELVTPSVVRIEHPDTSNIFEGIEGYQQHVTIGGLYHNTTEALDYNADDIMPYIKACSNAYESGICVGEYFGNVIDVNDGDTAEESYAEIAFEIPVYKGSQYYVNCIILSRFEYYTERQSFAHVVDYYITGLQSVPNP